MAAGAIIRALGWLVRHSHDEEHDKDGDILREMVVEARDELDAFGAATVNHRHEVAALLAEAADLRAKIAEAERQRDDARAEAREHNESHVTVADLLTVAQSRAERAEAAWVEMRAALEALLPIAFPVEGGSDGCGTVGGWKADALHQVRTALSRTDLGRGMVAVPREVLERWRVALDVAEERMCSVPPRGPGCVCRCPVVDGHTADCPISRARHDLDALLDGGKKGGG